MKTQEEYNLKKRCKDHDILLQLFYYVIFYEGLLDNIIKDNPEIGYPKLKSKIEVIGYKYNRDSGIVRVYIIYPNKVSNIGIGFEEIAFSEHMLEKYYEFAEKDVNDLRDYR